MEYGKILEIKKGLKTLIDLLNFKGEERISLTKTDLMEYLEAIETLEIQKNELLSALKIRIADDLAAGADSAEYLETTIYKVLEEVFDVKCVPVDVEANITVMVLDAEEYFNLGNLGYPEEFEESLPHKKYEFNSPKEFVKHWYGMEGDWYWVFHLGELICSGAIDPSDIEIFEEHFGEEFISPDEVEEVKSCVASMLEDFDLGATEVTDDDYLEIIKMVSDGDKYNTLEDAVKAHLWVVRERIDDEFVEGGLLDVSSMSEEEIISSVIDLEDKLDNMCESEIDSLVYEYIRLFRDDFTKIEKKLFEKLPEAVEKYRIGPELIDGEANENCFYNCDAVYMEAICEVLADIVIPVKCGYGAITLKEEFTDEVDTENSVIFRIIREYLEDVDLDDYGLGGVEITEDDCKTIYERLSKNYSVLSLSEVVDQYLREIRKVLDDGLAESLPKSVVFTASELAVDTDSVYEDKEWLSEIIGNRLSNTYGFCHEGFDLDVTYNEFKEPSEVVVSNIKWDTTE